MSRPNNFTTLDALPRTPDTDNFPIAYYQEPATAAVKSCVTEYLDAVRYIDVTYKERMNSLKGKKGRKADFDRQKLEDKRLSANATIEDCMRFFESERFDVLMPGTDKKWFIDAIKEKAQRTMRSARRM